MKIFWWGPALVLLVLAALTGDWLLSRSQSIIQQQDTQQHLLQQLASALKSKPEQTEELLTLAAEVCQCEQLRLQQQDGTLLALAGPLIERPVVSGMGWQDVDHWRVLSIEATPSTQLISIVSPPSGGPRWTQVIAFVVMAALSIIVIWLARRHLLQQQHLSGQIQRLAGETEADPADFLRQSQQLNMIEVEVLQRRQQEQDLREQLIQLNDRLNSQQADALQQAEVLKRQVQQASHQLSCWQALAGQAQILGGDQLSKLVQIVANLPDKKIQEQHIAPLPFAKWFSQQFVLQHQAMPIGNALLPDEDPAVCRWLVDVDYQQLAVLINVLFELFRLYNEGPETLFGYRLVDEAQPYLVLTLQYNGKELPARIRQIIEQGPVSTPDWPELLAEIVYDSIRHLSGSWQLQQLADVGSRLVLHIPLRLHAKSDKKLCQNMLVYDGRDCRQGLWLNSLRAVAEQLVLVSSLEQLVTTTHSRLIDMVVVHLREEQLTGEQLQQLKLLAHRYPLTVFATMQPEDVRAQLQSFGRFYASPVLLGAMCDQPAPDNRLANQQLLVVDDNQTNLSFIRAMLAGLGVGIDYATSGKDAIRYASHSRYQLILMDIQLPDLAGTEVTKQIRQLRHHQQTQILAFTAHALPEEVASFKLAGMDDVLFKPLDERKIAHILHQLRPIRETT